MKKENNKIRFAANFILGAFLFCFLYFILWVIFKEKMPLHRYLDLASNNYDFYASRIFSYLPLLIFVVIAILFLLPNSKKKFLRLQASLPTSKIKSLAKGLIEIQGKLIMKTPLISPVGKQECIGYHYTIENIDRDKDGKKTYTTIHKETKCNVFAMQDETGAIEVIPEGIEFFMLEKTNISSNNSNRYSEILIKENQEMLLIGYADSINGIPYIRKDEYHKLLGITSASGISVWNKYQPLLRSFLVSCLMIALLIIFILSQ